MHRCVRSAHESTSGWNVRNMSPTLLMMVVSARKATGRYTCTGRFSPREACSLVRICSRIGVRVRVRVRVRVSV